MVIRWRRGAAVLALAILAAALAAVLPAGPGYAADSADLAVTVTGTNPGVPGETVTWAATVTNRGPSVARDVALTLAVPLVAGESLRPATSTIGPCSVTPAGAVSCDLGDLAVTGAIRVTAVQVLSADRTDPPSATATVVTTTPDPGTADNSATAKSALHPVADLWLTQHAEGTNVVLGDPVTLVLTLVNLGPSTIPAGTKVTETLPVTVTYTPSGSSSGCTGPGPQVTCVLNQPLPVGGRAGTTLVLRAMAMSSGGLTYSATATPPDAVSDPDPGNNKAAAANPIGPQADVGITTSGGTDGVAAGTSTSFTYTVGNDGPGTATGVTASEALPAGLRFDSSASGCTAAGQTVTCPPIDSLPAGANRSLVVTVQVDPAMSAGTVVRTVRVSSSGVEDPNGSNQTGYAPIEVTRPANVALSAGRVGTAPAVGGQVTYELTVRNLGPATATGVTVTDRLPAEVTLGSATVPGGTCTVAGELHTCTLAGSLTPDSTATVTVTGTVTGAASDATLTDRGYATANESEPDPSDNEATTSEIVQAGSAPDQGRPHPVTVGLNAGTGLRWLTWAGGGTVLFGLVLLVLAGRRMVLTRSARTGGPLPPRG
ncbi:MAG: DUF11 domain-containing protein [Actinobacteria bacterium]|nr:MAG: DUF11 domain-containing protein [Actinomycetota bacterium]